MTTQELLASPDQYVWAEEFCRIAADKGFDPTSKDSIDWLATWFANAMMNGYDRAKRAA